MAVCLASYHCHDRLVALQYRRPRVLGTGSRSARHIGTGHHAALHEPLGSLRCRHRRGSLDLYLREIGAARLWCRREPAGQYHYAQPAGGYRTWCPVSYIPRPHTLLLRRQRGHYPLRPRLYADNTRGQCRDPHVSGYERRAAVGKQATTGYERHHLHGGDEHTARRALHLGLRLGHTRCGVGHGNLADDSAVLPDAHLCQQERAAPPGAWHIQTQSQSGKEYHRDRHLALPHAELRLRGGDIPQQPAGALRWRPECGCLRHSQQHSLHLRYVYHRPQPGHATHSRI